MFPFDEATEQYFTMLYGILDVTKGEFRYVSAGHPGVADVRGEGLMQAIGLNAPLAAGMFTEALLERGVVGRALAYANSVAFSPPLIISDDEVDELVAATGAVLDQLG